MVLGVELIIAKKKKKNNKKERKITPLRRDK
jgi:hypothetical protein